MSEADRYLADSADFVRSLDPCGFLIEADLAALGTVVQLRPDGDLSTCSASLNPPKSSATDSVTIDLNGHRPSSDDRDTEQVTIGGEQAYLDDSSQGGCGISFALRDEFDGATTGTMDVFLAASGRSFASIEVSRRVGDACTAAKSIAETALGLLDDPPLRAESKYNLPLASKDLCAVLEHLPATWTVDRWRPGSDPYRCHFMVSSSTFEQHLAMLHIDLGYVDSDLRSTDREPVQQGGYTVETRGSNASCFADIVLGNPVLGMPEKDNTAARYARTTPTLSIVTDDCDSAVALAVAAADLLTG
ncbi:putative uncharacterized protein [Rhodococcus sp. AW25M09]|uniref:hypothetical protein n=1 Tax=Rhodococcus sp. AW25M09 TaxID=1268303 RepID=UPI0002AC8515|nr:hypothetical protein [Rhodococcus sp. AW25M09]CCQ14562.1 putative uncharacterized protein [Rhodococcus sp. AW25M09]